MRLVIIIGGGRVGSMLARRFAHRGDEVVVIDPDRDAARRLGADFGGVLVVGDGAEREVLVEANVERAAVVVTTTGDDRVNLMVAQMARDIYGVAHVASRVADPDRVSLFRELGIATVCPSELAVGALVEEVIEEEQA
jgi:trk system potassium uptake protein